MSFINRVWDGVKAALFLLVVFAVAFGHLVGIFIGMASTYKRRG